MFKKDQEVFARRTIRDDHGNVRFNTGDRVGTIAEPMAGGYYRVWLDSERQADLRGDHLRLIG